MRLDCQGHVQVDEGQHRSVFAEPVREFREPEPMAIDCRDIDRANVMILDCL
jgi:hypothetical protein